MRSNLCPRLSSLYSLSSILYFLALITACQSKPPYEGKSVAELERMLHASDTAVQSQGAFGLSRLGTEARPAVPALIELLGSKDPFVRQNVALALGQIGPEAREAVPVLTTALHDPEWSVRRQAAISLGQIGPEARPALSALEKLRQDPDALVRKAAQEAARKVRTAKAVDKK
jgi:HEAT repeat protein